MYTLTYVHVVVTHVLLLIYRISHFKPASQDEILKKGMERFVQSVQAKQPQLTNQIFDEEEGCDHNDPSTPIANHHSMSAILEAPEPGD